MAGARKYENYTYCRLVELGIKRCGVDSLKNYDEPHRFYHNWEHIIDLLEQLEKRNLLDNNILFLATIFHDIVYNPKRDDNEDESVKLFLEAYGENKEESDEVVRIIRDTKNHRPSSELSKIFCEMDLDILSRPLNELIEYENKIFKEFQFVDWEKYKIRRVEVLRELQAGGKGRFSLEPLIAYIETRKPSIGIYCGSFDPMTKGHYNILLKAENIFDKVIIARGQNTDKGEHKYELPQRIKFRQIEYYGGLLTQLIIALKYDVTLIRGLRNATDLQYEVTQYRFLQDLKPDIKVVSIFCDKEYEHISSSAIRQLKKFGKEKDYLI